MIRKRGNEFGAVTGRPRRCGWFDVPLLRYTAAINGFDSLVITKLDVLDDLDSIPVCTGYRSGTREVVECRPLWRKSNRIEPVYESVPGWRAATFGISSYDDLPQKAKEYLAFLESRTGVEVGCISTGPERNQTIVRPGSRFEKLVGNASPPKPRQPFGRRKIRAVLYSDCLSARHPHGARTRAKSCGAPSRSTGRISKILAQLYLSRAPGCANWTAPARSRTARFKPRM